MYKDKKGTSWFERNVEKLADHTQVLAEFICCLTHMGHVEYSYTNSNTPPQKREKNPQSGLQSLLAMRSSPSASGSSG